MEPTAFKVKEESQFANKEPEFVKTKLMTRLTYTLDEVSTHPPRLEAAFLSIGQTRPDGRQLAKTR